ncbi:MAG TPA: glycerol-3-phosphate dehydrogenase, partial [Solirubrobacteraceae bacterium]|nr:glycerol-3-phosphate dehydrogenase [Solirubrobacteraceae bacterium]
LAGAGDLVAAVVADSSAERRAGELLGRGVPADHIEPLLGRTAEGLDVLPLLAQALRRDGVAAPTVTGLAAVVEGSAAASAWARSVTDPSARRSRRAA